MFCSCKLVDTIYIECKKMIKVCIILAAVTLSTAQPFKCPGLVSPPLFEMEIIKS